MREEAERVNSEVADLNVNLSDSLKKLHEAQDELLSKSKMEQLGQLTATVAHEIRNPLGSVRTSAFLIGRKVDAKKMGIDAQLDRINKGVDRCDSIITQLLDFSRVQKISTQASRLDDWLESVVREEGENVSREVAIECHLGLGNMEVGFDQARMRRAIINLINNAAEAMVGIGEKPSTPDGWTPLIRIETLRGKNEVRIIVSDNGPGMTPEVLAKVREPLFTTKNFGTGLGIPAVEQIANQHGGELSISSEVGQGAIFTISIPISQTRSEAA
jgi:signal transduction histidine kinase